MTDILMSGHQMLAALLEAPELELDSTEASRMHEAAAEVMKHYAISIDPKKLAVFNLMTVAGGIYGTRLMAYRARRKRERAKGRLEVLPGAAERPAAPETPQTAAVPDFGSVVGKARVPSELWGQSGIVNGPIAM